MDDDFMKQLNEEMERQRELVNRTPIEDFDNLSPEDMFFLVHKPLQEGCCIQYKKSINPSTLDKIPFLNLVEYFLKNLQDEKTIKLTPRENLPTKLVKELYGLGLIKEYQIESGITKLSKEQDSISITNVKIISILTGLVKKQNKKLTLTKKGEKQLKSGKREELLKIIFNIYGYKFNLGYHDGYSDKHSAQSYLTYTLFQLLQNGEAERPVTYYSQKMLKAFPHILLDFKEESYSTPIERFERCYEYRLMRRFLNWFNFIKLKTVKESGGNVFGNQLYIKTDLLSEVFEIRNENFRFIKPKDFA